MTKSYKLVVQENEELREKNKTLKKEIRRLARENQSLKEALSGTSGSFGQIRVVNNGDYKTGGSKVRETEAGNTGGTKRPGCSLANWRPNF